MKTVIKLGGSVLVDGQLKASLVEQIVKLKAAGREMVVVHGGGKQIASMLLRLGIESKFYDGLRVTDSAAREVIQMVLAGQVGKELVAEFARHGSSAVSFTGGDGQSFLSRRITSEDGTDLGYVGSIAEGNPGLVNAVLGLGAIPVVACLGFNLTDYNFDNVNGDQMAAAVAEICSADELIFVTDVGGVKNSEGEIFPVLTRAQMAELLESGVASGGMRPKLRSCDAALGGGVSKVLIVGAGTADVLLKACGSADPVGTAILPD